MSGGLALKYRPVQFEDAIGQDVPVRYLSALIRKGKVRKNIILAGQTGSGKTTLARIYARALNCTAPLESGSPCNQCDSCMQHLEGRYSDYSEYDAASHSKVDQIRQFIQVATAPPMFGETRVLLLDEAHALSKQAWDSLLKVVEEPPPYLVFIFATTEPEKIRDAIKGRCQTLTVNTLNHKQCVEHLSYVCQEEGFTYDDQALSMLSYLSQGHPRNLLNYLEKASFLSEEITVGCVQEAFQISDVILPVNVLKSLISYDYGALQGYLGKWSKAPKQIMQGISSCLLTTYFRHQVQTQVSVCQMSDMIPFADTLSVHECVDELAANQKGSLKATYAWMLDELAKIQTDTFLSLFSGLCVISLKMQLREFGEKGESVHSDGIEVDDASKRKQLKKRMGRRFHGQGDVVQPSESVVVPTEEKKDTVKQHINPYDVVESGDFEMALDKLENNSSPQAEPTKNLSNFGFVNSSIEGMG